MSSHHILLLAAYLLSPSLVVGAPTVPPEPCRVLPGDLHWPTLSEWDHLNATIQGRLIQSVPLGSPCHDPTYDAAQCEILKETWQSPQSYFGHPTQIMAPIFQNLTCAPYTAQSSPCRLGNIAVYAINVAGADDVVAGLRFAQRKNLRTSIKNTGHDYLGKSGGQGSLGFWMHNLKSISFSNHTSAKYNGTALKMGAGVQAFEAYEAATKQGLRVVGGDCPTVGLAGGYSQAAGHGPLSTAYGLGADQVLEWEVVTAKGQHLIATPDRNADLYWALSGGGGGTYGVVLSMTAKAYKDGTVGGAGLTFSSTGLNETYWTLIELWQETLPGLVDRGVSIAAFFTSARFTLQAMTKLDASEEDMVSLLRPFTTQLQTHNIQYNVTITSFPRFIQHVDKYFGPLPYGNYDSSSMVGGRLIPRTVVSDNNPTLASTLRHIAQAGYEIDLLVQNVSHASVGNTPADTSVHPAWRASLIHVVVAEYWEYDVVQAENAAVVEDMTTRIMPLLYDITPGSGVYLSEADYRNPDWKDDFYGVNYRQLETVKKKYDPDDLFYATTAVGSDAWRVASDGRLCRAL